jgi:hypothetical protein
MHTIIFHLLSFHIRPLKIRIMFLVLLFCFICSWWFFWFLCSWFFVPYKHFCPQTVLLCSPAAPATSLSPARSIASLLKGCARPKDKPDGRHSIPEGVNACSNAANAVNDSHDEDIGQAEFHQLEVHPRTAAAARTWLLATKVKSSPSNHVSMVEQRGCNTQ